MESHRVAANSLRRVDKVLAAVFGCMLVVCAVSFFAPLQRESEMRRKSHSHLETDFSAQEPDVTSARDMWFRCPQHEASKEAISVNLSSRCPDTIWVRRQLPHALQSPMTSPSTECLVRCLESACCFRFRSETAGSCELSARNASDTGGVSGPTWFEILGTSDWRETFPSQDGRPRLSMFRGPPRFLQPTSAGRWRGADIQLHVVDHNGDILHIKGGARVSLSRRVPQRADWVYELVEFDVEGGAISHRFETRLPASVAWKTTYVVKVLFAPHRRDALLSHTLELEFEFLQMPPPVEVTMLNISPTYRNTSLVKLTLLDRQGQITWPSAAANGKSIVTIRSSGEHRSATTLTALLVYGEAFIEVPCALKNEVARLHVHTDGSHFDLVAPSFHCTNVNQSMVLHATRIALSISVAIPLGTARTCLLCALAPNIRRRLIVITCHTFVCGGLDDLLCIPPEEGCGATTSEFVQHYQNLIVARRVWTKFSLRAVFLIEANELVSNTVEAAALHSDLFFGANKNVSLTSIALSAPHQVPDVEIWRVPLDVDSDSFLRSEPWWRHIAGMPSLSAWLTNRGRFVASPTCLAKTERCCLGIHSEHALGAVLDGLMPLMPTSSPEASLAEGVCLNSASLLVMVLTVLAYWFFFFYYSCLMPM
jgi:hypothetical protein